MGRTGSSNDMRWHSRLFYIQHAREIMHNRFVNIGLLFLVGLFLISGCAPKPKFDEMKPDSIYRYLVEKYDQKKYLDASEGLAYFTLHYSGHVLVDSAQFLLGQCHFQLNEYLLAADAFEELSRRFQSSRLVPEAMFMVGRCYWEISPKYSLDQAYTTRAIDALQAFIDYFPNQTLRVKEAQTIIEACREKLAHKQYSNGLIYQKMKDSTASIIYFQSVVDQYYDTYWADMARLMLGNDSIESYRDRENTADESIAQEKRKIEDIGNQLMSIDQTIVRIRNEFFTELGVTEAEYGQFLKDVDSVANRISQLESLPPDKLLDHTDEMDELIENVVDLGASPGGRSASPREKLSDLNIRLVQLKSAIPLPIIETYLVVRGDCLWRISGKEAIFNDSRKWMQLYIANRETVKDPDLIYPGQKLFIPRN